MVVNCLFYSDNTANTIESAILRQTSNLNTIARVSKNKDLREESREREKHLVLVVTVLVAILYCISVSCNLIPKSLGRLLQRQRVHKFQRDMQCCRERISVESSLCLLICVTLNWSALCGGLLSSFFIYIMSYQLDVNRSIPNAPTSF